MDTIEPQILFKYKSVTEKKEKKYTFDIFRNKRIYLPNRTQLNDPFEGIFTPLEIAVTGSGLCAANDSEHYLFKEKCNQFKILSLSETAFSPQMWAYYANSYTGICIGFYNSERFENLTKVKYSMPSDDFKCIGEPEILEETIRNDLEYKHKDWQHEKEWRIISQTNKKYLSFFSQDIACVIVGEKASIKIKRLKKLLPPGTPVLKTVAGKNSFRIRLLEYDQQIQYDGSIPSFIDNDIELYNYLLKLKEIPHCQPTSHT